MEIKTKNTLTSTEGDNNAHINTDTCSQGKEQNSLGFFSAAGKLISVEVAQTIIYIYLISMAVGSQGLHCNPAFSF